MKVEKIAEYKLTLSHHEVEVGLAGLLAYYLNGEVAEDPEVTELANRLWDTVVAAAMRDSHLT